MRDKNVQKGMSDIAKQGRETTEKKREHNTV